jgi:broad specificity phosphatase PhoE
VGRLILVRHGQASFLSDDYDRLSDLGREQARLLGGYLLHHGLTINATYTGPRLRQIDTGRIVGETLEVAGQHWPDMETLDGLDECHSELLLDKVLPLLGEQHEDIHTLIEAFEAAHGHGEKRKAFQRMFDRVMRLYIHGRFSLEGLESWADFTERVNASLSYMMDHAGKRATVVAFTSGGPIAIAAQRALNTDPDTTLEFMWQGRNAAVTEFVFSRDRFTLVMYNAVPHLSDAAMWTHR